MSASEPATRPERTPPADVNVDVDLVRALLADQHPDLAHLDPEPLDVGWDNALFVLRGAHDKTSHDSPPQMVVRLPRRQMAAALLEHEQDWLPRLAPHLPLSIPVPLRTGRPGRGYPWRWSVLPWLPGQAADLTPVAPSQAHTLAAFLRALHVEPPPEAPLNPFRGVPLATRREAVDGRLARLAQITDSITDRVREVWRSALTAPAAERVTWVHGDLHARNVLVHEGAICAVIDWGDICRGDPATDLAAAWTLLDDAAARRQVIELYGPGDAGAWLRAAGWAVSFGAVLLETGLADHPRHARMGRDILRRIDQGPCSADPG